MNDHRTPRALVAAATLALALGACSDVPTTAPAARIGSDALAHTASGSGITLVANTVKYRDNGGKPATGRSGSAEMEALALLGKDGVTDFHFRPVGPRWWVWGTMTRAQVRALDDENKLLFQYNDNNPDRYAESARFESLARGQYLQVTANVTGIDPHRTDVVTVTERIKLRPDLAVTLQAPPQVPAGQSVPITATVTELNGDVGAHASCVLRAGEAVIDYAWGIWIDAGDAVTCAFTHTFAPGAYDLQVDVADMAPEDWDRGNNRSEVVRIEAVGGPTEFNYTAYAEANFTHREYAFESRWHDLSTQLGGEEAATSESVENTEFASMTGFIGRALSGDVSFEVSQSTDDRVLHADTWTTTLDGCTWRVSNGGSFYLCSYTWGSWADTWFDYRRSAGTVTYHSIGYYRVWDDGTGEDLYYYHYNDSYTGNDGTLAGLGSTYAFRVRVTQEDLVLTANSEFPITHLEPGSYSGGGCDSGTGWWDEGYTYESCSWYKHSYQSSYGSSWRFQ